MISNPVKPSPQPKMMSLPLLHDEEGLHPGLNGPILGTILPESDVFEPLRCPGCQTSYQLRRARVHEGLRRAQCFRCQEIFPIVAEVSLLLMPPSTEANLPLHPPLDSRSLAEELDIEALETPLVEEPTELEDLQEVELGAGDPLSVEDLHPSLEVPPEGPVDLPPSMEDLPEPLVDASFEDLQPSLEILSPGMEALPPVPAPPIPETKDLTPPSAPLLMEVPLVPSASLPANLDPVPFDLSDLGMLEPLPEPSPATEVGTAPANAPTLTLGDLDSTDDEILDKTLLVEPPKPANRDAGGGFSSAKDAISRILGGLNAPAGAQGGTPLPGRRTSQSGVDMEATLDALEHTLGGTPAPQAPVPAPVVPSTPTPPSPTATMGSTVRLSMDELRAAMGATPPAEPRPAPTAAPLLPSPPTDALNRFGTLPRSPLPTPAPPTVSAEEDPNLLKVQVNGETYTNVAIDHLVEWVEQGRVLESHLVARQFSDHWIEAAKVPALRPIFERMKRMRSEPVPSFGDAQAPQKKSLFGGLFGRN